MLYIHQKVTNWDRFNLEMGIKQREIFVCGEGNDREKEFTLFSRNHRFCDYTQKVFVLENLFNFVSRMFFWFIIDYSAIQLAVRRFWHVQWIERRYQG